MTFHVDVNFGDPIHPHPEVVHVPRLLGGAIEVAGYPLVMIHAEKLVTMIQREAATTRWRDFADVLLALGNLPRSPARKSRRQIRLPNALGQNP